MSTRGPQLGPCIYRALDGVSYLAAMVTLIEPDGKHVSLTLFPPDAPPLYYNRVKFSVENNAEMAPPGTAFWQWLAP